MRYALYLMPEPTTPLWAMASSFIGYDSARGIAVDQPGLPGVSATDLENATLDPRRYGFHLTLKAPFRLAEGLGPAQLEAALTAFCAARAGFDLGALTLEARLGADGRGFVCLVPEMPCPPVFVLEQDAVRHFEPFRAPLNSQEIARRKPDQLTARQRHLLETYGYPFVLEEFRPHFSLTGMVEDPLRWRDRLAEAWAAQQANLTCRVEGIALCVQSAPDAPFSLMRLARFHRPHAT